jgi:hypothetical protein
MLACLAGPAAAEPLPADKLAEPPLGDLPPAEAAYVRKLHAHIHRRWAENFLRLVGETLPLTNPLNDGSRVAEVDITIAADGQLVATSITKGSGFPGFDDAMIDVLRDAVPYPRPTDSVRSDDDRLHVHWSFARDQRRCAGLTVLHVNDPIEIAVPKLMRAGRSDEILARVAAARAAGTPPEPMMSTLAHEWMKGALHEPWATVRMVRDVASRGDAEAVAWLRRAAKNPDLARDAGEALAANKIPICPVVKSALEGESGPDQQMAAVALASAGEAACAPGLIALLQSAKARPEARVAAANALGPIDDEAAKHALAAVAKDEKNNAVRAAAMLAQIRAGAGRGKVLAVVPFLRDPSPELRAAAAAGVVRAGGDANLDDLYLLFKDDDARPSLATLRELKQLPGEKANDLIGRLARRPQLPVKKAAAELLMRRHARGSFSMLKPYLDPGTDPQLRGMALTAADDATLAGLADDARMGVWVYRARLARSERDRAADWLATHLPRLSPPERADALADWLDSAEAQSPMAAQARRPAKR